MITVTSQTIKHQDFFFLLGIQREILHELHKAEDNEVLLKGSIPLQLNPQG